MRVMDVPEFQDARDLAAVNEGLTVRDAAILMAGRNVGAVIVLRDGCMSGIFTERDLMTKVAAQGLDCGTTLVRDVMTPRVVTVSPEMELNACLRTMTEGGFRHLPVVDSDGEPMGMISQRDFVALTFGQAVRRMRGRAQYGLRKLFRAGA
jgi:CBS domain-containing protein